MKKKKEGSLDRFILRQMHCNVFEEVDKSLVCVFCFWHTVLSTLWSTARWAEHQKTWHTKGRQMQTIPWHINHPTNIFKEVDLSPACDPWLDGRSIKRHGRRRTDGCGQFQVVVTLVSIVCHLGVRYAPALPLHWASHFVTVLPLLLMFYHIFSLLELHCHSNKRLFTPFPKLTWKFVCFFRAPNQHPI